MDKVKAIVDFSDYKGFDLAPLAQSIHEGMSGHAATFPSPPVPMLGLQAAIDDYKQKLAACASGAKADTHAAKRARKALESALKQLGNYVNTVADGDAAIVIASGFPSYPTARRPDHSAPAAPANLVVVRGVTSGTIKARYRPARARSLNEIQVTEGDPNEEAGWRTVGLFSGGKAEISGLTPKSDIWVRVRTCGIKGVMGMWSDPAKITVL
jgi:hypothetical protein